MSLGKKTKVRNMKFIFACICGLVLAFHWSTLAYRVNMHHTQSDILAFYHSFKILNQILVKQRHTLYVYILQHAAIS